MRASVRCSVTLLRGGNFVPPPPNGIISPASNSIMAHYCFDFVQQVHYPSNPLQPGPIYFLTPRKAAIFGVCSEAIPRQVNFVVDEASDTGKGANTVVSMLDFFFSHYGLGETTASLHADNCCGQNKNNTMVQYLMWRVLTGLHQTIKLHFMITGHTKFSRRLFWPHQEEVLPHRGQLTGRLGLCSRGVRGM